MSKNKPSDLWVQGVHICLHIHAVWSESSLGAFWIAKDTKCLHAAMKTLIRLCEFTGRFECLWGAHVQWYIFWSCSSLLFCIPFDYGIDASKHNDCHVCGKYSKTSNTKVSDKMMYASSADPEGAVWSGSTMFAIPLSTLSNRCITRIPRKASSHLLAQKSQEPQSECGY